MYRGTIKNKPSSELCTLYIHPDYRKSGLGRILSLVRFLYMAQYKRRFKSTVITEIRGILPDGRCPFWDYVISPFFKMTFPQADFLSQTSKEFIADLVPKYPIYVNLLPRFIDNLIGQAHSSSIGAENSIGRRV